MQNITGPISEGASTSVSSLFKHPTYRDLGLSLNHLSDGNSRKLRRFMIARPGYYVSPRYTCHPVSAPKNLSANLPPLSVG